MYSQNESILVDINTMIKKEYDELSQMYQDNIKDTVISHFYAKAFLLKAKKEKKTSDISEGYYMLAKTSHHDKALLYLDTIIEINKNINDFVYPAKAHLLKAQKFGIKSEYKKAIDQLTKANEYANENKNIDQKFSTKYYIAILKNEMGEYEESLKLLKATTKYYKGKSKEYPSFQNRYIRSLFSYGNTFNLNKKYDSAYYYTKKGIQLSLQSKDSIQYGSLLLSSAVIHYQKKEYQSSLDSLYKLKKISKNHSQSKGTLIRSDLYLGKIYFAQNKFSKAIPYLKSVDSIAFSKKYFFPSVTDTYELLIRYFKEQKNTKEQIYYIDRLLTVDSIMDNNYKYISKQINRQYSTPNLILEKQTIINSLQKRNTFKIIVVIILSLFLLILFLVLIRNIKKKKIYEKRFQELLNVSTKDTKKTPVENQKNINNTPAESLDTIGISDIIVNDILKNLDLFEKNKDFLTHDLTVSIVSKKFKTNSKYLSKVINFYKNKSFSNYINELRINYVVKELKTNTKFRKYTIKAIANEIGFNTTEAFSKSFYKITGIYPSFFLKQLDKQVKHQKLEQQLQ